MAISGFVAFSRPIVVVRSAPGGAEQNEPAPCVGYTGVASGSAARRRNDRNCARANGSVISGDTRSVRAAAPTINDPPVNTANGVPAVLEDVGRRARRYAPGYSRSAGSTHPDPGCPRRRRPGGRSGGHQPRTRQRGHRHAARDAWHRRRSRHAGASQQRPPPTSCADPLPHPGPEGPDSGPPPAPGHPRDQPDRPGCPAPCPAPAPPTRHPPEASRIRRNNMHRCYSMEYWNVDLGAEPGRRRQGWPGWSSRSDSHIE